MITTRFGSILVISHGTPAWLDESITDYYHIVIQSPFDRALDTAQHERYNLLVVVASGDYDALWQVEQVRRLYPDVPVWFVAHQMNVSDYRRLLALGVGMDNVLPGEMTSTLFKEQVSNLFRVDVTTQGVSLDSFNRLAEMLNVVHGMAQNANFIHDFLDKLCNTYNLYGATILIKDEAFKIFSLRGGAGKNRFHSGRVYLQSNDVMLSVMVDRKPKQLGDIANTPGYVASPVLPDAQRALIMPLTYHAKAIGTLVLFSRYAELFTQTDIHIFSVLASHFTIAFSTVHRYERYQSQERHNHILLEAWKRLAHLQDYHQVADTLHDLVVELPYVQQGLVWLAAFTLEGCEQDIISAGSDNVTQAFATLRDSRELNQILKQFHADLQPILMGPQQLPGTNAVRLFNLMRGSYLIFMPIFSAKNINGTLAISLTPGSSLDDTELELFENLLKIAGQILEHINFMRLMDQKSHDLETILRSISEGVFFIDKDNHVLFANPQLSALTAIPHDDIVGQSGSVLFRRLAECADDFNDTLRQFMNVLQQGLEGDPEAYGEDRYQFEIPSQRLQCLLRVELVMTRYRNEGNTATWLGIVRVIQQDNTPVEMPVSVIDQLAGYIRLPYAQANSLIDTLLERYERLDTDIRRQLITRLQSQIHYLEQLWEDLLKLQDLQNKTMTLSMTEISVSDLIEKVFELRILQRQRRDFEFRIPNNVPLVQVDMNRMARAIARILYTISESVPHGTITTIRAEVDKQGGVRLSISNDLYVIPADGYRQVFQPTELGEYSFQDGITHLRMYLARAVINKHGSPLEAHNIPGKGTVLTMILPRPVEPEVPVTLALPEVSYAAPAPELQGIIVLRGTSRLWQRVLPVMMSQYGSDHVYECTSLEDVQWAVKSRAYDIILVDATPNDADCMTVCRRLRDTTKLPVLILSDNPNVKQKVTALSIGVNDYLNITTDPSEVMALMAKIENLVRRTSTSERTQEPVQIGKLHIDLNTREVFLESKPLDLTRIEYELLRILAINPGTVIRHEELLTEVWGPDCRDNKEYLWVNMSRLRRKVEFAKGESYIQTRSRVGYFLHNPEA